MHIFAISEPAGSHISTDIPSQPPLDQSVASLIYALSKKIKKDLSYIFIYNVE